MEAYRYFTQLPEVTSASIRAEENENIISVQSMWSQRDIDRKEKTSFGRTYVLDAAKNVVVSCSSPQEINNQYVGKNPIFFKSYKIGSKIENLACR